MMPTTMPARPSISKAHQGTPTVRPTQRRGDREHAVSEGVGAVEQHQCPQGDPGQANAMIPKSTAKRPRNARVHQLRAKTITILHLDHLRKGVVPSQAYEGPTPPEGAGGVDT